MTAEFRLREMRKRAGMTQIHLAKLIGVDHDQISKWENGRVMPLFSRATDIAIALGCTLDELAGIDGTDDEICGRR